MFSDNAKFNENLGKNLAPGNIKRRIKANLVLTLVKLQICLTFFIYNENMSFISEHQCKLQL